MIRIWFPVSGRERVGYLNCPSDSETFFKTQYRQQPDGIQGLYIETSSELGGEKFPFLLQFLIEHKGIDDGAEQCCR